MKDETQKTIFSNSSTPKAVGPNEAVIQILKNNCDKSWTPSELRDELKRMKDKNLLITDSDDLLTSVHNVLQAEIKKGKTGKIIKVKGKSENRPEYKYKKQDNEENGNDE